MKISTICLLLVLCGCSIPNQDVGLKASANTPVVSYSTDVPLIGEDGVHFVTVAGGTGCQATIKSIDVRVDSIVAQADSKDEKALQCLAGYFAREVLADGTVAALQWTIFPNGQILLEEIRTEDL